MAAISAESFPVQSSEEIIRDAKNYLKSRGVASAELSESAALELPIIDLEPSFSTKLSDRQQVARQIRDACSGIGFFYIKHHGVPSSVCSAALQQAARFFQELSPQQKDSLHTRRSKLHRGYESRTSPTAGNPKRRKEAFSWGYEDAMDPTGGDGQYVDLDGQTKDGQNLWPPEEDLPGFYQEAKVYYGHVLQLARHLFRLFALSLDLPEDYFDPMVTHPGGMVRMNYFPATPECDGPKVNMSAHTDYECFTILLCSSTPGLEILSPASNEWISAKPVPGSFVVNVADFLMRWTNGLYQSTIHRVAIGSTHERYSVPFFFSVNYDCVVETLPTCVTEKNPSRYPPVRAGQYVLDRLDDLASTA